MGNGSSPAGRVLLLSERSLKRSLLLWDGDKYAKRCDSGGFPICYTLPFKKNNYLPPG
jgi:hypothetical protein